MVIAIIKYSVLSAACQTSEACKWFEIIHSQQSKWF